MPHVKGKGVEMYFDTFDHFHRKSGSNVWPSDNPDDSPYDTFVCKHCAASKSILMYGSRFIGDRTFEEEARIVLKDHLSLCTKFNKEQRVEENFK